MAKTVLNRVAKIVAKEAGVTKKEVTPELSLERDLLLNKDSIELILVDLEDQFGILFDSCKAKQVVTVQDIADLVKATRTRLVIRAVV